MKLKISSDFSDTPGARYYADGDFSGQEFYEKKLKALFQQCISTGEILCVDFDDSYGYASSFLSESFGKLSEEFGAELVLRKIKIISFDEPLLKNQVESIIKDPKKGKRNEKN